MIPPKAIKKVKNEIHLEIAAGSLIAYGIFPQTSEGIQKAKETAASKDTWLAPSDLPEYYDGIDSDLMTGKENDAIRAIRKQLKQFYGISSAGTEGYIDTRSSRPSTPAGIEIQWFSINQVGPTVWEKLKAQLTGKGYFSEVNLSEKDADELIANIKKGGEFPSLKNQSGIHNEVYQNWLVDTYLPNYGKTQVYNPGDKFVDDGKEFADKIVDDLDVALEETSNEIEDAIDAILKADKKKYEDFKNQLNRKVNHPKLYEELQHVKPRYMWGQNGLYDLVFKSDIDRAIYFAGKLGGNNKDSQDKVAVRQWLFLATGLNVREDYEEIKEYRAKILEFILQLVKLNPNETEVIVPPIYDGYYQDPDEDEEEEDEEEMDDEDYDDLYGNNLDDLLNEVREDEKEDQDDEQVIENIQEEILDVTQEEDDDEDYGSEDDIPDELLQDEIDPALLDELLDKINKPKKESSYTSNKKILDAITSNFGKINTTLEAINSNLEVQNNLIKANIDAQLIIGDLITNQTDLLSEKFDILLQHFENQTQQAKDVFEQQESDRQEAIMEASRDAAGTSDYTDLTKKDDGKSAPNRIARFYKSRLTRSAYRRLPKSARQARQRVRKLQRMPSKAQAKVVNKLTSMLPAKAQSAAGNINKVRMAGKLGRFAGPAKYALAGLEYSERKQAGQNEVQALSGVGGGLAGAAAGGAAGAKAGAALGAAIGVWFGGVGAGPGALIGGVLGGLVGSIGGGLLGGGIADSVTGVHETGTGLTKPGVALLHGTEAVINQNSFASPMDNIGGTMIAATTQYINSIGSIASPIAPVMKGISGQMAKQYDVPNVLTQTNVGGNLPSLESSLKKIKEKKQDKTEEDEFTSKERELLETQGKEEFAEKLLKIIDPDGKIMEMMKNINLGNGGGGGGGDSTFTPSSGDPSGLAEAAESLKGMSSASAPDSGANGCVWAVNKVYQKAGITPPWGSSLYVPDAEKKMIAAGYTQVSYSNRKPGDVMVMYDQKSPPQAHIGVVLKNGNILSNSSSKAKFAWEASPEQYNSYYGGTGKIYRMPSTVAQTNSGKVKPVATGTTPSLSSSGIKSSKSTVSNNQHQITPSSTKTSVSQSQNLQASNPPGALVPGQRPDVALTSEQFKVARQARETGKANGLIGQDLERHVASAVMNAPKNDIASQISAPSSSQRSMEIATLSSYEEETGENSMLIINNQSIPQPSSSVGSGGIVMLEKNNSASVIKNLMLQRLIS